MGAGTGALAGTPEYRAVLKEHEPAILKLEEDPDLEALLPLIRKVTAGTVDLAKNNGHKTSEGLLGQDEDGKFLQKLKACQVSSGSSGQIGPRNLVEISDRAKKKRPTLRLESWDAC
jgi:hypothetical protein